MMRKIKRAGFLGPALFLASSLFAGFALASELYIYPNRGQGPELQSRDRYECHTWAVRQTGFDPTRSQAARGTRPPPREAPQGGLFRGAARGAALGAVGGAIGGDAGKGAAIGAGVGSLFGAMRRRDQRQREAQAQANWAGQQQASNSRRRSEYNRAMGACLAGRGYTVR